MKTQKTKDKYRPVRTLTLYQKFQLKYCSFKKIPEIRLCGERLRASGFEEGELIEELVTTNLLTIRPIQWDKE